MPRTADAGHQFLFRPENGTQHPPSRSTSHRPFDATRHHPPGTQNARNRDSPWVGADSYKLFSTTLTSYGRQATPSDPPKPYNSRPPDWPDGSRIYFLLWVRTDRCSKKTRSVPAQPYPDLPKTTIPACCHPQIPSGMYEHQLFSSNTSSRFVWNGLNLLVDGSILESIFTLALMPDSLI